MSLRCFPTQTGLGFRESRKGGSSWDAQLRGTTIARRAADAEDAAGGRGGEGLCQENLTFSVGKRDEGHLELSVWTSCPVEARGAVLPLSSPLEPGLAHQHLPGVLPFLTEPATHCPEIHTPGLVQTGRGLQDAALSLGRTLAEGSPRDHFIPGIPQRYEATFPTATSS